MTTQYVLRGAEGESLNKYWNESTGWGDRCYATEYDTRDNEIAKSVGGYWQLATPCRLAMHSPALKRHLVDAYKNSLEEDTEFVKKEFDDSFIAPDSTTPNQYEYDDENGILIVNDPDTAEKIREELRRFV